jgi:AraC-like DNA-binding protein
VLKLLANEEAKTYDTCRDRSDCDALIARTQHSDADARKAECQRIEDGSGRAGSTISQVAADTGFGSTAAFSFAFRQIMKMTPTAFLHDLPVPVVRPT